MTGNSDPTAEHPAQGITDVLLPSWVQNIQVVVRNDSRDVVTVAFTRRWVSERWMAMTLGGTPSTLIVWCLQGGGQKFRGESQVRARVSVPPRLSRVIRVRAFRPDID